MQIKEFLNKFYSLPGNLQNEVVHYMDFLLEKEVKNKRGKNMKKTGIEVLDITDYQGDISEEEWLYVASRSSVYDFLKDDEEDIYSINDGKPFTDR